MGIYWCFNDLQGVVFFVEAESAWAADFIASAIWGDGTEVFSRPVSLEEALWRSEANGWKIYFDKTE